MYSNRLIIEIIMLLIKKLVVLCLTGMILALSALAQNEKKDSTWRPYHCASSITGNNQPLIIINGINVKDIRGLKDIIPDDIIDVKIARGQEAIDAYGEEGKNGAILYRIKIDLISSEEILQNEFKKGSSKNQKLIFKPIHGNKEKFNQRQIVYFEKNRITVKTSGTKDGCIVIVEEKN
jgi:hypothetical protein